MEDVTLRYVRLRDYHGDVHYVRNGLITTVTNLSSEFLRRLKVTFDARGIEIPYPQVTFHAAADREAAATTLPPQAK